MKNVLILGATGRTGSKILEELATDSHYQVTAGLRKAEDFHRLPQNPGNIRTTIIDVDSVESLRLATNKTDIIVNAIRLRENIPALALVELDKRIRLSSSISTRIITVGGAGSLEMSDGTQFWTSPVFPARTLPRGRAHALLRHHLETITDLSWTYLIPPPAYLPDGLATGNYRKWAPSEDERFFLAKQISYDDFSTAICDAIKEQWTGSHLIATSDHGHV